MFSQFTHRRSVARASLMAVGAVGIFASAFLWMRVENLGDSRWPLWLAAALLGGWLVFVLGRALHLRTLQAISSFVSEAAMGESSASRVERRRSLTDPRREAQESEVALLQMTLGPRIY